MGLRFADEPPLPTAPPNSDWNKVTFDDTTSAPRAAMWAS